MTREEYIKREIAIWGEDCIFDLLDRGYDVAELVVFGELRWWWIGDNNRVQLLWSIHDDSDNSCNVVFSHNRDLEHFTPVLA